MQVERRQEGDHSLIKRGASLRKVSGSYVSTLLRMREVLKIFESGPGELSSSFVSEFARILHPDDMARKLGFYRHPLYAEAVQDKASFHDKRKLAGVYMYSLDIVSQYTMQKAKQKKREQRAAKKARVVEKWKKSNAAAQSFSGDVVEREALADHLQSVVAEGGSNVLFSVPRAQSRQSMPVRSLQASLVPRVRAVSQLQLEVDGESVLSDAADSADAVADSSDLTVFQVLPLQLHRQKLVQMPAASARRLTQHDVCVTLHDSRRSNGRYVVAVEASRATSVQSPVAVLSVCDAEVGAIRTQLTSWNRRKSGSCILEGVAGVVVQRAEEAIRKLMACRAFPNTGNVLQLAKSDAQMLQQLESLRDCSVVECLEDGPENSKWCFSLAGAGKLRVATDARCPELVFKPLADLSLECLESGTCWQLYQALQQKGFKVKQRPKSKKAVRQLAPLTPESAGADLVWYLSGTSMLRARKYMITLIRAEEMFASGGLSRVYHCQPVQYYSAVLHEGHTGSPFQAVADEPVAALQLDVEQAPGPQALLDAGSQEPAVPSRPSKRARRAPVADAVPPASSALLDPAVPPDQTSDAPQALSESDSASGLSSESLSLAAQFWTESENEDVAQLAQEHVQAEGGENEVGSETPARTPPGAGVLDSPFLWSPGTPASPRESADDRAPATAEQPSSGDVADDVHPPASVEISLPLPGSPRPDEPDEGVASSAGGEGLEAVPVAAGLPASSSSARANLEIADSVAAADGDAEQHVPAVVRHRRVHEDSFVWHQVFRFTWSSAEKRPPFGSWQATCPYHKVSHVTGCKKAVGLLDGTDEEKQRCCKLLKLWCLQAPQHDRRRSHAAVQPRDMELLDDAVLEARVSNIMPPPETVETDEALDARAKAAAKARLKAKAKPKPKAKTSSKAKAKPGAKAKAKSKSMASRGPDHASCSDEAASDPPSSSSSGSSSEESSSSSGSRESSSSS